jgi:hypothetical protein
MPLKHILKNKLLLQKHFHLQEYSIDEWPFWIFEENISLVNDILEEEEDGRKKQEQQGSVNNFDPSSVMKNIQNMTNNIPKYK